MSVAAAGSSTTQGGEPSAGEGGAAGTSAGGASDDVCVPACETPCTVVDTGACLGNRIGVCASDGVSLKSTTSDCAASGQVCNLFGFCANTATDVVGGIYDAVATADGEILVDIVDVASDRVVTGLESELVLHVDTTLTWVIYEWKATHFELAVSLPKQVPANFNGPPGTQQLYMSSTFGYTFRSGRRYALGLVVGPGVSVYPSSKPEGRALSFGQLVGGAIVDGADYHDQTAFEPTHVVNLLGLATTLPH